MDTNTIPLTPINPQVHRAIEDICLAIVEYGPESQELLTRRDELVGAIEDKVERKLLSKIHDLYLNLACHYGVEMFRLGLALGRNPALMLDLPDLNTMHSEASD